MPGKEHGKVDQLKTFKVDSKVKGSRNLLQIYAHNFSVDSITKSRTVAI